MKKYFVLAAAAALIMILPVSAVAEEDAVIAKIGATKLRASDLKRIISYNDAGKQKAIEENPQNKVNLLKRFIQAMVIAGIARDKGFDKLPDIKEQVDMFTNDFLANEYIRKEVAAKAAVTEEDVRLYYKVHQDEFAIPEMVRVRHLIISADRTVAEEDKRKAREKAAELLKRVRAGEDFAKLAAEFSEDPASKTKGGDLGFFTKGKMVPEFEAAAFSLKPGAVSDIVETQFGYHIIKVEEKKERAFEPFDKVRDKVKEKVFQAFGRERVKEFMDKVMTEAGTEIYFEKLFPQDK